MAGDQIEIQLPKTQYFEKSSFTATAYFRTRSTAAAATPTTVHYRIDNLTSRNEVKDWTSVSPSTSVSITVAASENVIDGGSLDSALPKYQVLQLTVALDKDLSTQVTQSKTWRVKNLLGVT